MIIQREILKFLMRLINFYFYHLCFFNPWSVTKIFFPLFYTSSIVLALTCRFMTHLESGLYMVWNKGQGSFFFFFNGYSVVPTLLVENILSSLNCFDIVVKNQLTWGKNRVKKNVVLGQVNIYVQKNKVGTLLHPYTTTQNGTYT